MSKAKRKKQFATQQKAADAILSNRDLEKSPLTRAEIMALPRNQRPPRSEWPNDGLGTSLASNPEHGIASRYSGGGSDLDFLGIIGFMILWAVCGSVLYFVYDSLGMILPYSMIAAVVSGLLGAMMIRSGATGGVDVTHWW
jgi:hypothetical protein